MRKAELRFRTFVVVGTLLLGACNAFRLSEHPDDKAITTEVQAKLFQDPVLKTRDIRVVCEKGVVVLTGAVTTEQEKSSVERLANEVKGVKRVIDQLGVSATTPPLATSAETPPATAPGVSTPLAIFTPSQTRPGRGAYPARRDQRPPLNAGATRQPETSPAASDRAAVAARAPASDQSIDESSAPAAPAPPPTRQPERVTVPAGSVVTVRMIDSIDSSRNRPGEEFAATVDAPVVVGDRVVIPRGSDARVRLVESRSAGHMTGRSELQVELVGLAVGSQTYAVESGVYQQAGASRGTRTAQTVGGGAALGALIGAVAGKGKGAAIGAAVGAGAGTAVQAATRGEQVQIPAETKLDFTLKAPITLTL